MFLDAAECHLPISLQPWGFGTFCRWYGVLEVDGIPKMISWDEWILDLVFALVRMRITHFPFSSYPLWFGARSRVSRQYFRAILWIPAHTVSSEHEWTQHAFREWDVCVPQTCLWQICSFVNEVPPPVLRSVYFDLLPLGFNEQELFRKVGRVFVTCILRWGELKVHIRVQAHACVCADLYAWICVYARTCLYTCVQVFVYIAPSLVYTLPFRCLAWRHEGYCRIRIRIRIRIAHLYAVPRFKHCSRHWILTTPDEVGTVAIPIFRVRTLRHREVKKLTWGHRARKWPSQLQTQAGCPQLFACMLDWKGGPQEKQHLLAFPQIQWNRVMLQLSTCWLWMTSSRAIPAVDLDTWEA